MLLEWGSEDDTHLLLIDTGIPNTYRYFRKHFNVDSTLSGVVITHVDYDHLGGFQKLLNDQSTVSTTEFDVFMNTPSLALALPESDKVGLEHGIELEKKLTDRGITCKPLYIGFNEESLLTINGLTLRVLSPTREVIDQLLLKWTAEDLYKQYRDGNASSDKVGKEDIKLPSYDDIISGKESVHSWKSDLVNSSSIAFLATFEDHTILFLGDANPTLVAAELRHLSYSTANKLKVNLVKIGHHGSRHNSNRALYELIDCSCFLVSTDGTGNSYHPDRETIVRIAEYARVDKTKHLNFYLNYNLDTSTFISDSEKTDWNLSFTVANSINIDSTPCSQIS